MKAVFLMDVLDTTFYLSKSVNAKRYCSSVHELKDDFLILVHQVNQFNNYKILNKYSIVYI